jgi:hypothetical protein
MKYRLCAAVLGAALVLGGCSSSGGKSSRTGGPSLPASVTLPTSAPATPSGRPADAAVTSAVRKAYSTFFSSNSSAAASQAALQHGSAFHAVLAEESKSSYAQKTSVDVLGVRLASADVANVSYTLHTSGISLPSTGKAVRENGTWKVAAQTFCALLALQGSKPKPCTDPAVIALR